MPLIDAPTKSTLIVLVQWTMGVINALRGTVNLMYMVKCCVQVILCMVAQADGPLTIHYSKLSIDKSDWCCGFARG